MSIRFGTFSCLTITKSLIKAEMQRTQINQYCNNEVTRLDTAVLTRICTALDCRIEELLEFVPAKDKELP